VGRRASDQLNYLDLKIQKCILKWDANECMKSEWKPLKKWNYPNNQGVFFKSYLYGKLGLRNLYKTQEK